VSTPSALRIVGRHGLWRWRGQVAPWSVSLRNVRGRAGGRVGIAQVGVDESVADQGLDDSGEDTDGDVAPNAVLGPVPDGPQPQGGLQDPEALLNRLQRAEAVQHLFGVSDAWVQGGSKDVMAGQGLVVGQGIMAVVVDEPAVGDVGDVEQPLHRGAGQDRNRAAAMSVAGTRSPRFTRRSRARHWPSISAMSWSRRAVSRRWRAPENTTTQRPPS